MLERPDCRQVKGKGFWGAWEGIEKVMSLSPAAEGWVNRPLNYDRVQVRRCMFESLCCRACAGTGTLQPTSLSSHVADLRRRPP